MINMFLLTIWIICGIFTFICAAINEDYEVSIVSYFCCWFVLILELIQNVLK